MNAHAFRWQDVRDRREKLSLFSILFVKCNYCRKYQEAADKASSTRLLYGQIIIIMRLFHKERLPAFAILSRDHRDCLFILLVEPRSKFNKSRGKSRFSVCVYVSLPASQARDTHHQVRERVGSRKCHGSSSH